MHAGALFCPVFSSIVCMDRNAVDWVRGKMKVIHNENSVSKNFEKGLFALRLPKIHRDEDFIKDLSDVILQLHRQMKVSENFEDFDLVKIEANYIINWLLNRNWKWSKRNQAQYHGFKYMEKSIQQGIPIDKITQNLNQIPKWKKEGR